MPKRKLLMRIIHTADWHIGQTFYTFSRAKEHEMFLEWLRTAIRERGTDLLLIAGDVFDTPNPSAEAQRMFYRFLTQVTSENKNLQIIITAGNHDSAARLEAPSPLFDAFNIYVSGVVHYVNEEIDFERMIVPLNGGGCCLAVPYLRPGDYPESDTHSEGVAKMYSTLFNKAKEMNYSPIIAMGHLQASGAKVSVGDSTEHAIIGGLDGIDAGFACDGIAYTALGHLHKAQRVSHRENIRYSGAPLPMSFAESKNRQSVTEVIIEGGKCSIGEIHCPAPASLIRVPETPQDLESVLREISQLRDGETDDSSPYLQVRIKADAPNPDLRFQIDTALEGKAVRLANIEVTSSDEKSGSNEKQMTYDEFKQLKPIDLMKDIFTKQTGHDLPENLEQLLNGIIEEAQL